MSERMRFYDFETKSVREISESDLRPGMMQVQVQGVPGIVWIDSAHLKKGPIQREGLPEALRARIRRLHVELEEFEWKSLDDWEDEFVRDLDPESEVAIWERISATTRRCMGRRHYSPAERIDIYKVALQASLAPPEHVLEVVKLDALTRAEAEEVIEEYGRC